MTKRNTELAVILRSINNKKCLQKAIDLEEKLSQIKTLSLRNLGLNPDNLNSILIWLKKHSAADDKHLESLSFSYNNSIGDQAVFSLVNNLPSSLQEIGLVDCGISDTGGTEILNWMRNSPQLQMICIEGNNFSENLKSEFRKFKADNPQVCFVY